MSNKSIMIHHENFQMTELKYNSQPFSKIFTFLFNTIKCKRANFCNASAFAHARAVNLGSFHIISL